MLQKPAGVNAVGGKPGPSPCTTNSDDFETDQIPQPDSYWQGEMETTRMDTHTHARTNWGSVLWRKCTPDTAAGVHTRCAEEEQEDLRFNMRDRGGGSRRMGVGAGGSSGLIHTHAGALRRRQDRIRHGSVSQQLFLSDFCVAGESGGLAPGNALAAPPASWMQRPHTNQNSPDDGEGGKLLEVKGEVEAEARFEEGGDGF